MFPSDYTHGFGPPASTLTRPPALRIEASASDVLRAPRDHISEKIPPGERTRVGRDYSAVLKAPVRATRNRVEVEGHTTLPQPPCRRSNSPRRGHAHLDIRLGSAYVLCSNIWMPRCVGRDAEPSQLSPRHRFRERSATLCSHRRPSQCQEATMRATFKTAARSPRLAADSLRQVPRGPPPTPCTPLRA